MYNEKKILEALCYCRNQNEINHCADCPYTYERNCEQQLLKDVSELLDIQNKRIKRLKTYVKFGIHFKEYIKDELGVDDVTDKQYYTLLTALTPYISKLKTKEYRLLSLDNFVGFYGEDSTLEVKVIDIEGWFEIVVYMNPYKENNNE